MFVALFGSFQTSFWLLYWERKTSTSAEMKEYAVSQASHLLHTPRNVTFSVPDSHCQVDHHWQPYTFPSLHFLSLVLGSKLLDVYSFFLFFCFFELRKRLALYSDFAQPISSSLKILNPFCT